MKKLYNVKNYCLYCRNWYNYTIIDFLSFLVKLFFAFFTTFISFFAGLNFSYTYLATPLLGLFKEEDNG